MVIGISDKIIQLWLTGKKYIGASDEAEALAIGAGHYLATGKKATVFCSADGFMNMLNFLTSWIIPEKIRVHIVVSKGRTELPHYIATREVEHFINRLKKYDKTKVVSYSFVHP